MNNLPAEKRIAFTGMVVALMSISAFIRIPLPIVPLTFQPLVVMLIPMVFGAAISFSGMFLYLVIGLMGIPIFAHGGGPAYVLNPTFGYLIGFIISSLVIGFISERYRQFKGFVAGGLLGLIVIYVLGVLYLYVNINFIQDKRMELSTAIKVGFLVPIWFDIIKLFVASFLAVKLRKVLDD